MAEYLAELYVSRTDADGAERSARRTRLAASELTREGTPVRCVRSMFVPEVETCFLLFEAGSVEAVQAAGRRAALAFEHVAEVVGGSRKNLRKGNEKCSEQSSVDAGWS